MTFKRFVVVGSVVWLVLHMCLVFGHYIHEKLGMESPVAFVFPIFKTMIVPGIGLVWYAIAESRRKIIYGYIICAALGDLFLMSYDFEIYAIGGLFFFASHCIMASHFGIQWTRVPWWGFLMTLPNILFLSVYLIPVFIPWTIRSVTFAGYALFLEVGACSAVARVYKTGLASASFWLCAVGYFVFLVSDAILLKHETTLNGVYPQIEVMATYVIAQMMILFGVAIDTKSA